MSAVQHRRVSQLSEQGLHNFRFFSNTRRPLGGCSTQKRPGHPDVQHKRYLKPLAIQHRGSPTVSNPNLKILKIVVKNFKSFKETSFTAKEPLLNLPQKKQHLKNPQILNQATTTSNQTAVHPAAPSILRKSPTIRKKIQHPHAT